MKKKFFSLLSIAVAGSLSIGSAAMAATVNGSGATFPQSFLASATTAFKTAVPAHTVNYANPGGGSGAGQSAFRNNTVDYAGTDSALTAATTPTFGWVYVPYVAGAIGIGYRLDELGGTTLSLSPQVINGIFGGTITKWNDPSIVNDLKSNPL